MVPLLISADREIGFVSIDNANIASNIFFNPDCLLLHLFNGRQEPLLSVGRKQDAMHRNAALKEYEKDKS